MRRSFLLQKFKMLLNITSPLNRGQLHSWRNNVYGYFILHYTQVDTSSHKRNTMQTIVNIIFVGIETHKLWNMILNIKMFSPQSNVFVVIFGAVANCPAYAQGFPPAIRFV